MARLNCFLLYLYIVSFLDGPRKATTFMYRPTVSGSQLDKSRLVIPRCAVQQFLGKKSVFSNLFVDDVIHHCLS